MYEVSTAKQFQKDYKRCIKRGLQIDLLDEVVLLLTEFGALPPKYKPHLLSGDYANYWECHIKPDWLLLWKQNDEVQTIQLARTGSHSDLF